MSVSPVQQKEEQGPKQYYCRFQYQGSNSFSATLTQSTCRNYISERVPTNPSVIRKRERWGTANWLYCPKPQLCTKHRIWKVPFQFTAMLITCSCTIIKMCCLVFQRLKFSQKYTAEVKMNVARKLWLACREVMQLWYLMGSFAWERKIGTVICNFKWPN